MEQPNELPVAVIGAGPVGLAAAAHLAERGLPAIVLEQGERVAASVRDWGHVRLFTPWRYSVDTASRRLLEGNGWREPDADAHPTAAELIEEYLEPLAQVRPVARMLRLGHRVRGVSRLGVDKVRGGGRAQAPFVIVADTPHGEERLLARAVIDATGTWLSPNPLGAEGLYAESEVALRDRIRYGMPDVLGAERARYGGRAVAVVGSGHSAQNVVRDLSALQQVAPETRVAWVVRRDAEGQMFGGGENDQLEARGELGSQARALVTAGRVNFVTGFKIARLTSDGDGVLLHDSSGRTLGPVDEIVAATGARPDLSFLRELRLDLDPVVESTRDLAPLIDPNLHSCGSVPAHGYKELFHSEPDLFLVGAKSYGRAPTFLLATGYEQVRSVVAAFAGDYAAAGEVHLELPETGVCVSDTTASAGGGCCGTPASTTTAAQQALPADGGCCSSAPAEQTREAPAAACCGSAPEAEPVLAAAGSCCG